MQELRIELNSELENMIYSGYVEAYKIVKFVIENTNAVNTSGKPLMETALKELIIEGKRVVSCSVDTITSQLVIIVEDN